MIYHLDFDLNGADSIQHLIDKGLVKHLPCATYTDFDAHVKELQGKVSREDTVVVDTLSKGADTTRGDMKLGTDPTEDLWSKKHLYLGGDKNYLTVYEAAGQFLMRRIRNLRARGAHIITICHEDEQTDYATALKVRAPAVNEALHRSLMGSSSDVFRLSISRETITNAEGKVIVPQYGRILQLRISDEAVAKFHVAPEVSDKVPKNLVNPTLPKLYGILKKKPAWLVIYGEPGAGKTTLATSDAEEKVK